MAKTATGRLRSAILRASHAGAGDVYRILRAMQNGALALRELSEMRDHEGREKGAFYLASFLAEGADIVRYSRPNVVTNAMFDAISDAVMKDGRNAFRFLQAMKVGTYNAWIRGSPQAALERAWYAILQVEDNIIRLRKQSSVYGI